MADQFTPEQIEQFREQFRKLNEELKKLGVTAFKEMPEDINPIEKGTKGKIIDINTVLTFGEDHLIVHWENGRKINLLRGFDKYDVIQNIGNKFLNLTIKGY